MSVIQFQPKEFDFNADLDTLLKTAVNLKEEARGKNKIIPNFKKFISGKIMETIIAKQMIEKELILCGIYISNLLASSLSFSPERWITVQKAFEERDHNDLAVQYAANICFLACSLFKGDRYFKLSNIRYFGTGLYLQFYLNTKKEIGLFMSNNFDAMTKVTQECVENI